MESNTVNIKNLPKVEEIIPGNFIIVEDTEGSKILDFKNFVIGPNNTSFYNSVITNIRSVSTYSHSLCSTIAANQQQVINQTNTQFKNLTAAFAITNPRWFIYEAIVDLGVNVNDFLPENRVGRIEFVSDRTDLFLNDLQFIPGPANTNIYIQQADLTYEPLENVSGLYNYTISLTSNTAPSQSAGVQNFFVRILKPYF